MKKQTFFEPHYTNFLDLEVSPHLLKFLTVRYGQQYIVRQKSALGMMVIQLCRKRNYLRKNKEVQPGHYRLLFTYTEMRHYHLDMSRKKKQLLINILESIMREHMVSYVDVSVLRTQNARQSLKEWMDHYKILDVELNFESMYMYYRRSKKNGIKKIKNTKKD